MSKSYTPFFEKTKEELDQVKKLIDDLSETAMILNFDVVGEVARIHREILTTQKNIKNKKATLEDLEGDKEWLQEVLQKRHTAINKYKTHMGALLKQLDVFTTQVKSLQQIPDTMISEMQSKYKTTTFPINKMVASTASSIPANRDHATSKPATSQALPTASRSTPAQSRTR